MAAKKERFSLYLTPAERRLLSEASQLTGKTGAQVFTEALARYVSLLRSAQQGDGMLDVQMLYPTTFSPKEP